MLDRHHERDGRAERERPLKPSEEIGGIRGEREVPLAPVAAPDVINRWLDGELPEPTGLRGEAARSVEFWRRIGEETDRRRRMATPAYLPERILASLPPLATPQQQVVPWYRKELKVNPLAALAAAAALFTLGILAAQAMRR